MQASVRCMDFQFFTRSIIGALYGRLILCKLPASVQGRAVA
jgi:hypothetical protein